MFRSLLVPVDGSDYAQAALRVACRLAEPAQGTIHLLTVIEPFEPMQYGGDYRVQQIVREAVNDNAEKPRGIPRESRVQGGLSNLTCSERAPRPTG